MAYTGGNWTAERREEVFRRWQDGQSAAEIARAVGGVSRNAVLGVIHRAGKAERSRGAAAPSSARGMLERMRAREATAQAKAAKAAAKPAKLPPASKSQNRPMKLSGTPWTPGALPEDVKPPTPTIALADAFSPLPGSMPRTLMHRPPRVCTWPVGDDASGDTLFCCLPVEGRWCAAHDALNRARAPKAASMHDLARGLRRHVA